MNPDGVSLAVFLWGTLGFGIVAYLNSIFFGKAFRMIDPEKLEAAHEAPSEALFIDEEHRMGISRYGKASKAKKGRWR